MLSQKLTSRSLTIALFLLLASAAVIAQPRPARQAKDAGQSPDDQPRRVKAERGDAYTRWVGLAPGDYELLVRINDRVSGQKLAPAAKFALLK